MTARTTTRTPTSTPTPTATPYTSDLAYLDDALAVLRLRCRLAVHAREAAGLIPRDAVAAVSGIDIDPEALSAELTAAAERLAARLEATTASTTTASATTTTTATTATADSPEAFEPGLVALARTFELSPFEQDVLLMALAPAVDGSFNGLYGRLKGLSYRHPLDVDVALAVLADGFADRLERRRAFSPAAPLLRHSLLLLGRGRLDAGDDFLNLELRLPGRLVTLLLGQDGADESLASFSRLIEPTETLERVILPSQEKRRIVELVALHGAYLRALDDWGLSEAIPYGRGVVILFTGPSGTGKTLTARAVAHQLGRRLLLVDTERLTNRNQPFDASLDNLLREARLQNAVLFFDECEALFASSQRGTGHLSAMLEALEHHGGVTILATNVPQVLDPALDRRILYRVDFEVPTPAMREAIWHVHLPPGMPLAADVDVPYLARRFEFTGGYIKNAVLLAAGAASGRAVQGGEVEVTQADLLTAAYTQLRHRLNRYADREIADLRLTDLILPDDIRDQVKEIIEAVAAQQIVFREWGFGRKFNKGRGLAALFDGEPGTGKTLSAEVIAAELGMTLFRVNVANVVSKYIGETEKNLTAVFAEARSAQSVLLFDEADSLFSKRVEVKGSNDRFANMEINVLLQLIERYDGLVILTTNLKTSIDPAFERRLSFKINFPFPDADIRASIWEHLFPPEAPRAADLDFDELGRCFELSGGSIKNAVLRAAYRAAATQRPIGMDLVEDAAKRECQAAGKLFRVPRRDEVW